MYAKYNYMPGAGLVSILADIKKILTGTTDKNQLSSSCNTAGSYINSTVPAGWEAKADRLTTFSQATLSASANWKDIANNGTVLCAIAGGAASNLTTLSNDGGVTWRAGDNLPATAFWSAITAMGNGTLVAIAGGVGGSASNLTAISTDNGATWVAGGNLPASSFWTGLIWSGTGSGTLFALGSGAGGTAGTVGAISTNGGAAWTLVALPTAANWKDVTRNGNALYAIAGGSVAGNATAISTDGGANWVAGGNLPASTYWKSIARNGSTLCAIAGGNGLASTVAATSTDGGLTWVQRAIPNKVWGPIVGNGSVFMIMSNGDVTYVTSPDGITWSSKSLPVGFPSAATWTAATWISSTATLCMIAGGSAASTVAATSAPVLNVSFRAPNADGTSYKYINIDVSDSSAVLMRYAESMSGDAIQNPAYSSDDLTKCQLLDLVNGGILYIAATARYCYMLSHKPNNNFYGSSGFNNFNGVSEYSRDDLWSAGYPCAAFINSNVIQNGACYVPRVKSAANTDAVGSSASLSLQPNYSMAKQILDANGTIALHSAVDLRLSNTTSWPYTVLGGLLLGGIKRTTDAFGMILDETLIDGKDYVIWTSGAGLNSFRLLIPKF